MRYILIFVAVFLYNSMSGQIRLNVNVNLDSQPIWGPTGYDYVEYYYLPDIESYYSVSRNSFYFFEDGRWVSASSLPGRYYTFNLYKSYKIVINEREPWHNHKSHKGRYSKYKNRDDQLVIRDSRDSKYYVNKNHPEHNNWVKKQKRNNGNNKSKANENKQNKNHKK